VISIGILTPHAAAGPEEEFPAMAPGRIMTRVARISAKDAGTAPTCPLGLRMLMTAPLLEDAAEPFASGPVDVVGYASTSSAYAAGFDEETAVVSGLSRRMRLPVVATCASAVLALRLFGVERIAVVHPPWFDNELNELGASYFGSQGFEVVASAPANLSQGSASHRAGWRIRVDVQACAR
jgi:maleate isomerase